MRVLFVAQAILDQPHGGPRHVIALARELVRLGHEVTLLAPGREVPPDGVRRVRPPQGLGPGARLEAVLAALATAEVARWRPDVAYVRLSASSSAVPLGLAGLRVPVVLELNGPVLDELRRLGRPPAVQLGVELGLKAVVRAAKALVAVDEAIAHHAREALGAREVVVVENGADLEATAPGSRAEARARLGLPADRRLVAFAGTLVPEQRLQVLLAAMERLPEALLVVAGAGPQRPLVEAAARLHPERVRYLGPVEHAAAIDLLRAADIAVDVRESHVGMKGLELAALGRRFATFGALGVERIASLYPGQEALAVVWPRTAEALAAALSGLLEVEATRGPIPAEAVEAARAKIGWEHTAGRVAAVLARHARMRWAG